ncbi:hypothetical protein MO224_001284 [Listeria monocytogenes]|uniref:hypothetical protein n=1 Tax=Listeria seeligeri TaxID=1640 RepID=UPI001624A867|nr:hypothetical protein [Listeria seeligeri]EAG4521049.1 hypothetical protein [Listeria monocytogenes]MBC1498574.1 hypothetical protein [Listeria welshimeri]EFN6329957.1 hypothetical protein [Listeria monocytogenes]EHT9075530.1 hypothetical protein [Listeria monocytogenes]EIZ3974197.1 hypothetical protein [Listeria monocytogenes]
MTKSKITAYIPVNITIEFGKLTKSEEVPAKQITENITPSFIPYEDKMYVKVDREPQVDDVVLINKFDARVGCWTRRVTEVHADYDGDFFINLEIQGDNYFDSWEDEYLAIYAPVKENGADD